MRFEYMLPRMMFTCPHSATGTMVWPAQLLKALVTLWRKGHL